jgi:hypothetical protein
MNSQNAYYCKWLEKRKVDYETLTDLIVDINRGIFETDDYGFIIYIKETNTFYFCSSADGSLINIRLARQDEIDERYDGACIVRRHSYLLDNLQ